MIDERIYAVVCQGQRYGNLTLAAAGAKQETLERQWAEAGRPAVKAPIYYRNGVEVDREGKAVSRGQ